jgi:hypothetical protein
MRKIMLGQVVAAARRSLRVPIRAWLMLVQHLADQAATDPGRRAERLERPPVFPGAHANERWHAAEMQYREQVQRLKQQAERESEQQAAPWWRLFHIIYSWETFWTILAVSAAVWILLQWGVL